MGKIKKDTNPDLVVETKERGIVNKYYQDKEINEDLSDDIKTLQIIFKLFNQEFFEGKLENPIISISKMKADVKVSKPDHWIKKDIYSTEGRREECIGIYLSENIYNHDFKEVCITLLKAMIIQYDIEQYAIYGNPKGKHTYKRMVTNNNNYFSKAYANKCRECGLIATIIMKKNDDEKEEPSGKYNLSAGEEFDKFYVDNNLGRYRLVLHQKTDKQDMSPEEEEKEEKEKARNQMKLYKCPECGLKIRVKRKDLVDIRCFNSSECQKRGGVKLILDKSKRVKAN